MKNARRAFVSLVLEERVAVQRRLAALQEEKTIGEYTKLTNALLAFFNLLFNIIYLLITKKLNKYNRISIRQGHYNQNYWVIFLFVFLFFKNRSWKR